MQRFFPSVYQTVVEERDVWLALSVKKCAALAHGMNPAEMSQRRAADAEQGNNTGTTSILRDQPTCAEKCRDDHLGTATHFDARLIHPACLGYSQKEAADTACPTHTHPATLAPSVVTSGNESARTEAQLNCESPKSDNGSTLSSEIGATSIAGSAVSTKKVPASVSTCECDHFTGDCESNVKPKKSIVVVVGAGHIDGIVANLERQHTADVISSLSTIPQDMSIIPFGKAVVAFSLFSLLSCLGGIALVFSKVRKTRLVH